MATAADVNCFGYSVGHQSLDKIDYCGTSLHHHYEMIESEYARLMGMVHESDIDIFVRE